MSKKSKRLTVPEVSTEWMDICRSLNKEYRLTELREIAQRVLKINTSRYNKRELCMLLSVQFDKLKEPPKKHRSGCKNDESFSEFESFDEHSSNSYIKDQYGYCFFPFEILRLLGQKKPHPYNRKAWDKVKTHDKKKTLEQAALEFPTKLLPLEVEDIHRLIPIKKPEGLNLTYTQRQAIDKLRTELAIVEKRVRKNGDYTYQVDRSRVNDIDSYDIISTVVEYLGPLKAELEDSPLIRELGLDKYFRQEGSLLNFLNNTLKALRETRNKHFDKLQPLKKEIIKYFVLGSEMPAEESLSTTSTPESLPSDFYFPDSPITDEQLEYIDYLQAQAEALME